MIHAAAKYATRTNNEHPGWPKVVNVFLITRWMIRAVGGSCWGLSNLKRESSEKNSIKKPQRFREIMLPVRPMLVGSSPWPAAKGFVFSSTSAKR